MPCRFIVSFSVSPVTFVLIKKALFLALSRVDVRTNCVLSWCFEATVVQLFRQGGADIPGKTDRPEFWMGCVQENTCDLRKRIDTGLGRWTPTAIVKQLSSNSYRRRPIPPANLHPTRSNLLWWGMRRRLLPAALLTSRISRVIAWNLHSGNPYESSETSSGGLTFSSWAVSMTLCSVSVSAPRLMCIVSPISP